MIELSDILLDLHDSKSLEVRGLIRGHVPMTTLPGSSTSNAPLPHGIASTGSGSAAAIDDGSCGRQGEVYPFWT